LRALLVYNPHATTTRPALIDVITRALSSELKLDVEATKRRDHAGFLAAGAADSGYEVVVALGGDGTVNEVVQGVTNTAVRLAVIPGGSTNVFARALGLPNDPIETTAIVLRKLARREDRRVTLGLANDRLFTFNAGFGFDAEVVKRVEQRHVLKRTVRQASFFYAGLDTLTRGFDRRHAAIQVRIDGTAVDDPVGSVVVCNARPFTFLGPYAVDLCPGGSLDRGLAITGLHKVSVPLITRLLRTTLRGGDAPGVRGGDLWEDIDEALLRADAPMPLQVDGDHLGDFAEVRLRTLRDALTVIA
jgi:diacylglycerol kinase family enzyme